jgi:hypothetical protein
MVTFRYGLTRSKFAHGLTPGQADRDYLLHASQERITRDLGAVQRNETPGSASKVEFV